MTSRDPAAMTDAERCAEIASVLARGYRRFRAHREKGLDVRPQAEALCGGPVDGDGAETGQENSA